MKAKVKLAGADVGQVESMVARNYTAVTTLRIRDGILLPRGSTAELRTATPLGDVFVALKPPADDPDDPQDTPVLRDGDTIGLESTAAASTVESVLGSAAVLVNGGTVRDFDQHHQRYRQSVRRPGPGIRRADSQIQPAARHAGLPVRTDLDRIDRIIPSR